MAATDMHGTALAVGMRVEVTSTTNYMKRPKITAVGSGTVTLSMGIGAGIVSNTLRALEHGELGPTTGSDYASLLT